VVPDLHIVSYIFPYVGLVSRAIQFSDRGLHNRPRRS
jgi:hypothetical protein